jgi:hypothetical protein
MTYYHFEGSLVQPTMEEPVGLRKYLKWRDHLRSLPKIKVEGKLKEGWVEEGKDFVLEPKFVEYYPDRNPLGDTGANDLSHGSGYERIAVPVSETEANAETVEKKEDEIERLKKLLRMTDCPEALINGEITFKIQPVSELTGHDKEWAEREIKKYEAQEERKHTDKEQYAKGLLEWIRDQDYVLSDYRAGKWYQFPFRETSHYYTTTELLKEYDKYLKQQ